MTENKMSDNQIIAQFQAYQQQMQSIYIQRENMKMQTLEIDKALEELEASKEENAFKIVGPIMIKKSKDDIQTDLKEQKSTLELRTKTLNSAEEKITGKIKEMEADIRRIIEKK